MRSMMTVYSAYPARNTNAVQANHLIGFQRQTDETRFKTFKAGDGREAIVGEASTVG